MSSLNNPTDAGDDKTSTNPNNRRKKSSDTTLTPSNLPLLDTASSILTKVLTGSNDLLSNSIEQARQTALKAVSECPPWVHLSGRDSAPQLKIEDKTDSRRLVLKGGLRGYRMARATHGVSAGNYYYEALILEPPSTKDVLNTLPPNVKFAPKLHDQMERHLLQEKRTEQQLSGNSDNRPSPPPPPRKKRNLGESVNSAPPTGHVRIGWSTRSGDLQAPVGYDRWSYGIRDIMGSRIHNSRREDHWGGEPFGPGDVVGLAISLVPSSETDDTQPSTTTTATASSSSHPTTPYGNHIRFFKNGNPMGQFIVSRNLKTGGEAFDNIQPGTYHPAVSPYMAATVRLNFGPHFVYPIQASKLPSGLKLKPISELCPPPLSPEQALEEALKEKAFSRKTDETVIMAFKNVVLTEARIRYEAWENHVRRHVEEVREERVKRKLGMGDLPKKVEEEKGGDVDQQREGEEKDEVENENAS